MPGVHSKKGACSPSIRNPLLDPVPLYLWKLFLAATLTAYVTPGVPVLNGLGLGRYLSSGSLAK